MLVTSPLSQHNEKNMTTVAMLSEPGLFLIIESVMTHNADVTRSRPRL
jgi:hypothetical protein